MGDASSMLPPFMTGTGLEPTLPDLCRGTRNASNTNGSARHCTYNMDAVYCKGLGEKMFTEDTFLLKEEQLYIPWSLGESDMQSLFVEMHKMAICRH